MAAQSVRQIGVAFGACLRSCVGRFPESLAAKRPAGNLALAATGFSFFILTRAVFPANYDNVNWTMSPARQDNALVNEAPGAYTFYLGLGRRARQAQHARSRKAEGIPDRQHDA